LIFQSADNKGVSVSKIAIVTDSTAYIPKENLRDLPVFTIPLHVIWGDDMYRDNVDITQNVFYERLGSSKTMPSTSQPSPQEFVELYKTVAKDYDEILSIHISSQLSGTFDSAIQAKKILSGLKIEVIDSKSTSMGLGFLVLMAARNAQAGDNLQKCKELIESARDKVKIFFVLRTLEFLKRGGRIGSASALLGTALNLKPILMVEDGVIKPFAKVRTMQKALSRLVEILSENIQERTPIHLGIIQAEAENDALFLQKEIENKLSKKDVSEMIITGISPVIGTHTGPGAVGICFVTEK
jgi:DegV family protein with EDD domain